MKHTFTFTAHRFTIAQYREIRVTVRMLEDESSSFADIADRAEEQACRLAAAQLQCDVSEIELVEE